MSFWKCIKNKILKTHPMKSSGMGLVEVIVATAILGIVSTGIMVTVNNAYKQQKGIQAKDQQRDLTANVFSLLSDPASCLNTFSGADTASSASVNSIKDASSVVRYSVGSLDKSKLLQIDSIKVENFQLDAASTTSGKIDFKLLVSKAGSTTNSVKNLRPDIITLQTTIDAAGKITACKALAGAGGSGGPGLWSQSTFNPNDIYYSTGFVGVGNNNPKEMLEVSGNIKAAGAGSRVIGNELDTLDTASNAYLYSSAQNINIGNGKINIANTGSVGLGTATPSAKLDVNGEIKFGNTAVGCSSTTEGQQRYNSGNKTMEFCNGTTWTPYQAVAAVNCLGAFGPCSSGTRTYFIITPAGSGGNPCPYADGATDSTTCTGTACTGSWTACSSGSQTYLVPSNSGVCSVSNGSTQYCGSVSPNYSCPSGFGWTLKGTNCEQPAANNGSICYYTCQGAGGCVSQPCTGVSNSSCTQTFYATYAGTCNKTSGPFTSYNCPNGGTVSGTNCIQSALNCPASHPNYNAGTGMCDL